MNAPHRVLPRAGALTVALAAVLPAQVSVQVVLAQPLQLQAQVAGGPLNTLTLPTGTNVTDVGSVAVSSTLGGFGGSTGITVAPSTGSLGTTCVFAAGGSFDIFQLSPTVTFSSQQSGAELVTFASPALVGGAIVVEGSFIPSGGPSIGTGTISCDFGNDGSVELVQGTGDPVHHSQPCAIGPGQDLVLRLAHQGSLAGAMIGEYSLQLTMRFVPHADGLAAYGPPTGCRPVQLSHLLTGHAQLGVASSVPPVDLYVLAVGQSQVAVPMPIPSPCPLLASAELILGPFAANVVYLPPAALAPGTHVYLQFVGLHLATFTADASLGIHVYGQ